MNQHTQFNFEEIGILYLYSPALPNQVNCRKVVTLCHYSRLLRCLKVEALQKHGMEWGEKDEDSGDQDSSKVGGSSADEPHQQLAVVDNQVEAADQNGDEGGGEH